MSNTHEIISYMEIDMSILENGKKKIENGENDTCFQISENL